MQFLTLLCVKFSQGKDYAPSLEKIVVSCNVCRHVSDKEVVAGFNVRRKDTVHEMVPMFKELSPPNTECGMSQVDAEEWIDADKGIEVSHNITDVNLINAVTNPDPEDKKLQKETSDEEIATKLLG
jgi:hypothetical protein